MPDHFALRVASSAVNELLPERSLQVITDEQITYCQQSCLVADCALRALIERNPVTRFGRLEDIDLVTISCEDSTCGQELSIHPELAPTKAVETGMAIKLRLRRELFVRRGLIPAAKAD